MRDAGVKPMIMKCVSPMCPHSDKYYAEIKRRFASTPENPPELPSNLLYKNTTPQDGERILRSTNKSLDEALEALAKEYGVRNLDIDIPQQVLDAGNESTLRYVTGFLEAKFPRSRENATAIPHKNGERGELPRTQENPHYPYSTATEMDEEYTSLPKAIVQVAKSMKAQDPECFLIMSTPFGPRKMKDLDEANRIFCIINKYYKHGDELSIAEDTDGVTVFPLARALGFEEVQ